MRDNDDATIAVIDYGAGNMRSVTGALTSLLGGDFAKKYSKENLRIGVCMVSSGDEVSNLRDTLAAIVLPGVGSFSWAMDSLEKRGLDWALKEKVESGIPLLGICLGMHLLFEAGTEGVESGAHDLELCDRIPRCGARDTGLREGLGLLKGTVRLLKEATVLPHMGWDGVRWIKESVFERAYGDLDYFYFAHSYAPADMKNEDILAVCTYGTPFPAVVSCGHVFGVQFHPEKSARPGLGLLASFIEFCLERRFAMDL